MPGVFSKSARPLRPGAYFNWNAVAPPTIPPVVGSIVCIPFTSDWGPYKLPTLVESFQEYIAVYGPTVGTPGYNAVWQAFQGEGGTEGRFGAGAVLCVRWGASSAAKATKVLQNTTPAAALSVTAKYEGTYGNNITVTVQDHIGDSTQDEFVVIVNGLIAETYVYPDTNMNALATQINSHSSWVSATVTLSGVGLAKVANQALLTGADGGVLVATDWTSIMSALESQAFGVLCPYALTDGPTIVSLKAWAGGVESGSTGRNTKGQRFEVVLGGAADETAAAAVTAAQSLGDGNFCRVGMSHVIDSELLDATGSPVTLNSSQYAARVAGIIAGRGESMSLTSARLPGLQLLAGPTESDVIATMNGGVMVLTQDSDPDSPVHIEAARTTFSAGSPTGGPAMPSFPYLIYRNPKFMRTMQDIETEWTQWANATLIGKLPVNNKTREAAVAELQSRLAARESAGVIQPGWTVAVDENPPPSDQDEFIALTVGLAFGRSVEQVYFTVSVQ